MKKYVELRDQRYNWHPAIVINEDNYSETFLLVSDDKEVKLIKEKFIKRDLSITQIHIERLGFLDENKEYISKNGQMVIPVNNIGWGKKSQALKYEFFGYILFSVLEKDKISEKFTKVFNLYNEDKISKEDVQTRFDSFFTVNELFERLSKFENFEINEAKIIEGK